MNILTNIICIISLITLKFNIISANIGNNNVENNNNNILDDCKDNNEFNLTCQSARIMGNILKSIKDNNTPLILMPGLEIVSNKDVINKNLKFDGRSNTIDNENSNPTTFSGRLNKYLRNHELKIKFSELLDKNDFKETFMKLLDGKESLGEARRKPDRGMGAVMIMGLMMAKMMTTLGLGGIGALAMKALGVSMMALLLSGIIGLKSLTGGHDDGHHVQYITAHDGHHRKRRDILPKQNHYDAKALDMDMPLPFRGWNRKNI